RRRTTRAIGAAIPIEAYVGRMPIAAVARPMIKSEITSMDLRPTRSPKWPNTIPPTGRAAKPTPKVAKAASVPIVGDTLGKNSLSKTSAAAVPYKKKSYHSMVVPMKLARATWRNDWVVPWRSPPRRAAAVAIGSLLPLAATVAPARCRRAAGSPSELSDLRGLAERLPSDFGAKTVRHARQPRWLEPTARPVPYAARRSSATAGPK